MFPAIIVVLAIVITGIYLGTLLYQLSQAEEELRLARIRAREHDRIWVKAFGDYLSGKK